MVVWEKMIVMAAIAVQHLERQLEVGRFLPFDVISLFRIFHPITVASASFDLYLASGDTAFLRQLSDHMPLDPNRVHRGPEPSWSPRRTGPCPLQVQRQRLRLFSFRIQTS